MTAAFRLAAVLTLVVGTAACGLATSATPHPDGGGPLGAIGSPGREGAAVNPVTGARSWTFGVPLCVMDAGQTATLKEIGPSKSVGDVALLGVGVRSFAPSYDQGGNTPIISVEGYPPSLPDKIHDVSGFVVQDACIALPDAHYTELLVGLGYKNAQGGGWVGIEISYESGGHVLTLFIDRELLVCGTSVADRCEP